MQIGQVNNYGYEKKIKKKGSILYNYVESLIGYIFLH
jgi:hypothetical protein